ncbi:MAG TPA: hypothetical protein VES67_08200 [Vicinamibacterales bacterium]|nr:hypothetical protein [Vicinamibacterales bacterium]
MFALHDLLANLAAERPIFHSEADFQHAFAWLLQRMHPHLSVRLEIPVRLEQSVLHVDLLASSTGESVAIELKYKTRAVVFAASNEEFRLTSQAAQDLGRYDFIKDIHRLETLASARPNMSGYAVLLTNDSSYWGPARGSESVDAAFRLCPERTLSGALAWHSSASAGTVRGREAALGLRGSYGVAWRDYSNIDLPRYGAFKYLAVQVPRCVLSNQRLQPGAAGAT